MIRKTLLVLLWVGLVCGLAPAATKTVVLKDGSAKYTGEVTESGDKYQIKLPTGETITYPKDKVTVSAAADPAVEYKTRLGKIDAKDADGHTDIGAWAQQGGYLDIAYAEYSKALELKPGDERATLRLAQVKSLLDALVKGGTKLAATTKPPETGPETALANLVTDDDIYKIRMFEIKKREIKDKTNPPSLSFGKVPGPDGRPVQVQAEFIRRMRNGGNADYQNKNVLQAFLNLTNAEQLLRIMEDSGDQDLLDAIHITSDPEFMRNYKRDVAPQVAQNCAMGGCHGSFKGKGDLKLFPTIKSPQGDYTNFLILSLWAKNGQYLIDRRDPENSLLLQHGLPAKLATAGFAHSNKAIGRPNLFVDTSANNYQKILSWIKTLQGAVPPAYHTVYQPPSGKRLNPDGVNFLEEKPTSAPASKPADEGKDPLDK